MHTLVKLALCVICCVSAGCGEYVSTTYEPSSSGSSAAIAPPSQAPSGQTEPEGSDIIVASDTAPSDDSTVTNVNTETPELEEPATTEASDDPEADSRYTYSDDHDPNGIGKFYMGREIAMVMGHQGIAWLERPEREQEEGLSLLIECLGVEPGSTVADIGAGSGVITMRLCDAVGEDGTVVAVDIQQEMLDALQLNAHQQGYRNVELVLGTPETPQLEAETLDLVVMVDVYHEFDHPYEMLLNISQSLRPGGRIAFVEYRKEDPTVPIKEIHKMTEAQVRLEAEQPEFQLEYVETIDELPRQHVIIFRRIEAE